MVVRRMMFVFVLVVTVEVGTRLRFATHTRRGACARAHVACCVGKNMTETYQS